MPFTPFHFGPGLVLKASAPRRFWLSAFVLVQVVIDVEVLVALRHGERPLHREMHTYLGGTLAGVVCGGAVYIAARAWRRWRGGVDAKLLPRGSLLHAIWGGVIGAVTHVWLDSLMHADMHPWRPFTDGNGMLGLIAVGPLHVLCAAAGFFGLLFWWMQGDDP
jgi:hypothetical protein